MAEGRGFITCCAKLIPMLTPGQKLGRYEILELAGAGGMGAVYRARDTVLQRDVAVKTLSASGLDTATRKLRFMQEARAASSLNHSNIVTIHDIGKDGDADYIAMEFVQGRTLEQLIHGAGLPLRDAVRYFIQIASALEAAHAAGIVHRDLKPTNVMITPAGVVKVLDFGLAKLTDRTPVNSDQTVTGFASPTVEGTIMGTVAYMSPEQAEAKPVDPRSDIFSFGSVLYEAITGRRAFQGESSLSTLAAILRDQPVAPRQIVRDVPPELERIVQRCLEKPRDLRFESMTEVKAALEQVAALETDSVSGPMTGAVAAAGRSAASIAVLPFANLSADKENEYFSDGLAEELINALAKVKGLRVTARTSAFAFRDKGQDVRAIAQALNVESVLEGSVRKSGNRIRITAQLIKASDGYHLWSERYDRELTDIFTIQDELTAAIVDALCQHLGLTGSVPQGKRNHTPDLEAYNALLRARYHRFRFTAESWQLARSASELAVQLDPEYAEAWANLAIFNIAEYALDMVEPGPCVAAARKAAERALELDETLGSAHAALGTIHAAYEYDWERARQHFAHALQFDPNSPDVLTQHAYWYLRPLGRAKEARAQYRRVLEMDPLSAFAQFIIAESYFFEGKYPEVIESSKRALDIEPHYWPPISITASSYALMGDLDQAREWCARALALGGYDPTVRSIMAATQAIFGDPGPARAAISHLESRTGWARIPSMLTALYDALGDMDAAYRCALEMIEIRSARVFWLVSPSYRNLHRDPRFPELLSRLNLPLKVAAK